MAIEPQARKDRSPGKRSAPGTGVATRPPGAAYGLTRATVFAALWSCSAIAQETDTSATLGQPVAFDRLETSRGGFDLPSGLQASFGFARVVYVNGELVASTRVSIPDIAAMTPEQAQALAEAQRGQLLQLGDGNRADAVPGGGLVIQNTLDGQDIRATTTLDIGVNTLGLFQDLNAQAAMQDALIAAPGAP
jgi:hypothetical protein